MLLKRNRPRRNRPQQERGARPQRNRLPKNRLHLIRSLNRMWAENRNHPKLRRRSRTDRLQRNPKRPAKGTSRTGDGIGTIREEADIISSARVVAVVLKIARREREKAVLKVEIALKAEHPSNRPRSGWPISRILLSFRMSKSLPGKLSSRRAGKFFITTSSLQFRSTNWLSVRKRWVLCSNRLRTGNC